MSTLSINALEKAWSPWKSDEKEEISDCHRMPCKIKLNESEVKNLEKLESRRRYDEFLKLIQNRMSTYVQTGKRDAYEYPGGRSDLWATLGLSAKQPQIFVRKLDFGSDQMKVLRQVLDRQIMDEGMAVWVRDIYTNHYFDSWGEWTRLQCGSSAAGEVTIVQLLALELDLLKNTDLLSKLSRGKMKSVVKENGSRYLEEAYQRYLKEAHVR